ncbi:hypothetical protein [Magnetococcus sp. PR-3]|uniref:hypothetical protein n=1 Tax=Magnetococcus sp. PR-3 TaxID=3120355 RepID=UPI002FCE3867
MAVVMLVCDDLLSKVQLESNWKAKGLTVVNDKSTENPQIIALDLRPNNALERITELLNAYPDAQLVAFGPHVQVERLKAAKEAGAHLVVARSAVVEKVGQLATRLA